MSRRIVLIRAVNVGGATLPMARLRSIAGDLGATEVTTYIASGNLICTPPGAPAEFDRALESAITDEFGYEREVISRSVAQVRAAFDAYPFEVIEPKFSYIHFLCATPDAEKVAAFCSDLTDAHLAGGDLVRVIGDEVHIRYADGIANSTLTTAALRRGLGVAGTARNLTTVAKLIELAS